MMKKLLFLAISILLMTVIAFAQETRILPASGILASIKEYVSKNASCLPEELLIEYKSHLTDEILPPGQLGIEIKSGANTKFLGFTTLEVFILIDNKVYKNFLVYLEIDIKTKAYMADRWIKRYEPLTSENVTVVDTYRSKIPLDAIAADEELTGKVAKVAMTKGRIIRRSNVEVPPLIKSKDIINVLVENGNIKITARAAALMDARKDEVVKLRLLDSKKDIYGRVIDSATVVVESAK